MKKVYSIIILAAIIWCSCTKGRVDFLDANKAAPAQITNIKADQTPGGAVLTYKIPLDPNLSYVKAVYEIQPGVFREAKASRYTDSLKLVGFGDTLAHEVKVYSVGTNEKQSAPVAITVNPKTPPVKSVFKTVIFAAAFGGVSVSFKNPDKADLSIVIMRDTTGNNAWAIINTFYTAAISGNLSTRGLDSVPQKFALFIRDRWNNKSDTLYETLTPKYESQITKDTWNALVLPTDQTAIAGPWYNIENMWDGVPGGGTGNIYASSNASHLPQWFTFDLGKKVLLSRFKMFTEGYDHCYTGSAVKIFELYGSNSPDTDGGWTKWQLLGAYHSFKPSGLPLGQRTAEDINYAHFLGEDFNFDTAPAPVRYLRWKTLETYASPGQVVIAELSFWGQVQ
ncbi:MAG: DUF4959 domain-containing protein [Ferruginibacter sp.]|nr:DUF4959 domain-containing protein [Ferruginibacter sp.]